MNFRPIVLRHMCFKVPGGRRKAHIHFQITVVVVIFEKERMQSVSFSLV